MKNPRQLSFRMFILFDIDFRLHLFSLKIKLNRLVNGVLEERA